MAAGVVSHNITTASGVTFAVRSWVPDTASPDVGAIPVKLIIDQSGADALGLVTASPTANTMLGRLKSLEDKIDTLDASVDAVTTAVTAGTLATGQNTSANSISTVNANDQAFSASATFTPAAASHTAGDCNGAAQQFSTMGPASGRVMITSATLEIDSATAEATAWRIYLFNVTPPSAVADDGAYTLPSGDRASYLGYVDLGTAVDLGDTQWVETHGINKQIKLAASGHLFGYLVNLTTVTPANVAHIPTLHTVGL